MLFNLSNLVDKQKAITRFKILLDKKATIDLTEKNTRTPKQNKYLHLLINYFACIMGEESEYCKIHHFKIGANKALFEYERINKVTGEFRLALKSSKDLSTKEMTLAIDRFKDYSAKNGIHLPDATQKDFITEVTQEIERNKQWL